MIKKLDRHGATRCECTVTDAGIEYKGETFKSLSGAARAAAKDLGIEGAQYGYLFFGLVRPPARAKDPIEALEKAWERFQECARAASGQALDDETKAKLKSAIAEHLESLSEMSEAR